MAVIQDEQGNNKPIKTDTSHVFDVNGNPLHGELFIGETIASEDVEETDGYAHESEVAEINSYLAKNLYEKTYTNTSQTWQTILDDFYGNIASILSQLPITKVMCGKIILTTNSATPTTYTYAVNVYNANEITCAYNDYSNTSQLNFVTMHLTSGGSALLGGALKASPTVSNMSANTIGTSRTLRLFV